MAATPERINVHDAKTQLSRLLVRVESGEEIVIARDGKPVARLVPILAPSETPRFGTCRGEIWIADDFDAPLRDGFWFGVDE